MTVQPSSARTDTAAGERLTATPPPDPQDPLPESNWIPRRWSSFAVCIGGAVVILIVIRVLWLIANASAEARVLIPIVNALSSIAGLAVLVIVIDRLLLMVAPSAEQAIKMIQTAGLLLRGVTLRSETRTTATADAAETVTRTESSTIPPAPAAPVPAPAAAPEPIPELPAADEPDPVPHGRD